jgi:hypothetical protein
MRTLTLAAALALVTTSAVAIDATGTMHLEHLGHTGLGSPVPGQSNELIRVAQAAGRASAMAATRSGPAAARKTTRNPRILAERAGYKRVSSLVNFPAFFPGIGVVFVKPETLPVGPFLSFDRKDRLISTIYMLPLEQMNEHRRFEAPVGFAGARVDHTTMYFNEGHPGVDLPHYHYVLWHVSKKNEALVAN